MAGHWYKPDGTPCHRQLNKAQTKLQGKDVYRDTNLGDARKQGLFPSVSAVLDLGEPDWLVRYKRWLWQQVLTELDPQGNTMTRGNIETPKHYWDRLVKEWRKRDEAPMLLGTSVHDAIELYIKTGKEYGAASDTVQSCVASFREWNAANVASVIASEQTFCSPEWGYGGTIDLQYIDAGTNRFAITDYKTKATKEGVAIEQTLLQKRQLVAYALGKGKIQWCTGVPVLPADLHLQYPLTLNDLDVPILGNLYLSTTEPGRWEYIAVPPDEIPELILDVRDCVRLWQRENNFYLEQTNRQRGGKVIWQSQS